ncbi:MAG: hypothetical protein IKE89_00245 [Bacilli bacterium]|nr:hypothetical protein [Bacilli bacterium]
MSSLNNLYINNLYLEGNKQTIQTFKLIPNYEKIDEFVSEEIAKVPSDEIILRRDNPISFWSFKRKDDVVYDCSAYSLRKGQTEEQDHYLSFFEDVLKTGRDSWFEPESVRLKYKTGEELFSFSIGGMPFSIQTTEDLYMLGLLENRKFNSAFLQFGNLSEVSKLFSLSDVIHSIDLDEIDKLVEYGIISDTKENIDNYKHSSHVYKNLRQHYK